MSNRNRSRRLVTDKNTDYLFEYFMNEDKFNEQLKGEWDERIEKNMAKHQQPKLDSRILTDAKTASKRDKELPSHTINDSSSKADFNDESSESGSSESSDSSTTTQSSVKTPFKQRIEATQTVTKSLKKSKPDESETVATRTETPEERRARARDAYAQLENLVKKHGVQLSKRYTVDDDPDEMEDEYRMRREMRNKEVQVKFYKQILLNIVCGVEFLNEKYDPFDFKLKDWSKTIAADMDDYTEVLEELYEKYKNKGGNMPPEIRLLFMIIMSGVTYHLSKVLFGDEGLTNTIKNNPNVLNKLLSGFMSNKGGSIQEPAEAKMQPPNSKNLLNAIKNQNRRDNLTTEQSTETVTISPHNNGVLKDLVRNQKYDLEKKLAEQKAYYEEEIRKRTNTHQVQMNQIKQEQQNKIAQLKQNITNQMMPTVTQPIFSANASVAAPAPPAHPPVNPPVINDDDDIFAFEESPAQTQTKTTQKQSVRQPSVKQPSVGRTGSVNKKSINLEFDDIIDTLEEESNDDIEIQSIASTKKQTETRRNAKNSKSVNSVRSPKSIRSPKSVRGGNKNSTRSITKSDTKTESKKSNIIKL